MALLAALWRRLVINWHLKLAAILVAVVLWVYVLNQLDPVAERSASFPVQAYNVPQGLELLETKPANVTLKLRGRLSLLGRAVRSMSVWVDCKDRPVGESDVRVAPPAKRPPAVTVTETSPAVVRVRLDLAVSAQRRVTVKPIGLPAEGYQAYAPKADPAEATVHGPAGLVQRVARVVALVNIDSLSVPADRQVRVEPRDDTGAVVPRVTIEPALVHVVVPIGAVNVRVLPVYPRLSDPPEGYRLARIGVRPPLVILSGPPDLLRQLNAVQTELLDISSLRGSGNETIPLAPPAGCHIVGGLSADVNITVQPLAEVPTPESRGEPSPTPPQPSQPSVPPPPAAEKTPAPARSPAPPRGGNP